jgi:hypothetical protein
MSDLRQVRGTVGATAQNSEDRYGVRIGRSWFDGAGQCPVERGDDVEIAYSDAGRYRSIEEIRVVEDDEPEPGEVRAADAEASVDARIARAVALKCATALSTGSGVDAEAVLETARRFERWLRATLQ